MSVSVNGTNGITFNDGSAQNTAATGFGFKNRLINSAMMIDQRNAGASVTPTASGYSLDRWVLTVPQSSKFSYIQSTTAPTGFINSWSMTSLSAYSVLSTDNFAIGQYIEGLNVADLGWGTSAAATVTVSFWVRSSLTGTFGGSVANSASNRSYPFSYTINAANTWEQKTITIPGDTAGTWLATNGIGLKLWFGVGVGSTLSGTAGAWAGADYRSATGATSVVGTNGATFYITGVQLEKGSTATSFDYRPYGTELALCQRYYYRISPAAVNKLLTQSGAFYTTSAASVSGNFPVSMRIEPTALEQSGTANQYRLVQAGFGGTACTTAPSFSGASKESYIVNAASTGAAFTAGYPVSLLTDSTNGAAAYLGWSAEL